MSFPIPVSMTVAEQNVAVSMTVTASPSIAIGVATPIVTSVDPVYDGETEATPSDQEQVFQTRGKKLLSNFTVKPIPSNYGLITYNGSVITVS